MRKILFMFLMALTIAFSSCSSCHRENEPVIDEPSVDSTELVITEPEIMPEYVGGIEAMQQFIADSLQIPENYLNITELTEYRVFVGFVVEKDGSVTEVDIIEPDTLIKDLNDAAIEVVNKMPNWNPGMLNGEPVRVFYSLPIVYRFGE